MLEILEELDPGQKNEAITIDKCWIYWDNHHCGQCAADRKAVLPRIEITISSKRPCFQSISFVKGLFLSKHFRKEKNLIPPSLFLQFFSVSSEAWTCFARKHEPKVTDRISTIRNLITLLCHFRKIKRWDSPDCHNRPIPLIWHPTTSSYSVLEEKTKREEFQIRKRGDLCDEKNLESDCDSSAFWSAWTMNHEKARTHCNWGRVRRNKYQWVDGSSLSVREIVSTERIFGSPGILERRMKFTYEKCHNGQSQRNCP
jgi:hypothetical protein